MTKSYYPQVRDEQLERELEVIVYEEKTRQATTAPFQPGTTEGDLPLGFDVFDPNIIVKTNIQGLNTHLAILGTNGLGKSIFLSNICALVANNKHIKGQLIFDCKKSRLRRMKSDYERLGEELCIVEEGQLRINPLQPEPGIDPVQHINMMTPGIASALGLGLPAIPVIAKNWYQLLYDRDVLNGSQEYAIWHELRESILADCDSNKLVREAYGTRATSLLLEVGDEFSRRQGWTMTDLQHKNVLIEMGGRSDSYQRLITSHCLGNLFSIRRKELRSNMDFWCCMDDSQSIVKGEENIIKTNINVIREAGIGLCLSFQSVSGVDAQILANCGNKILGQCKEYSDLERVCRGVGMLPIDSMRWLSNNLQPGIFLGSFSNSNRPFVFKSPYGETKEELWKTILDR